MEYSVPSDAVPFITSYPHSAIFAEALGLEHNPDPTWERLHMVDFVPSDDLKVLLKQVRDAVDFLRLHPKMVLLRRAAYQEENTIEGYLRARGDL